MDFTQTFYKIGHTGPKYLPHTFYDVLGLYLSDRNFIVKIKDEQSPLTPIRAGVPQGRMDEKNGPRTGVLQNMSKIVLSRPIWTYGMQLYS